MNIKKELLQEYKNSLESAKNDKITPQQEAIIKVLLDENKKESSSLEKLLATTEVDNKYKDNAIPISSNTNIQQTSKTLYERHIDALKDDTNTFGAFLKQNDKAMNMLDDFTKNMSESEKGRFMFVFGGIGRESVLKEAFERGISPSEAIPYVQKEIASFKDNTVFTKALEEIFTDKYMPDNEIKQQVREFYELYTS